MFDGQNFFDQPAKNDTRSYDNIRNITTSQWDDSITGSLLDYSYVKEYYEMIPIYLS